MLPADRVNPKMVTKKSGSSIATEWSVGLHHSIDHRQFLKSINGTKSVNLGSKLDPYFGCVVVNVAETAMSLLS
jgi:hypothetical protein